MVALNTIRTTTLRLATEGAQQARSDLNAVADAEDRRAKAALTTANVVETSAKRQLNAYQALDRLNKQIDADYRARANLERASGTIERAAGQGLIDQAERAKLNELAASRYAPRGLPGNDNRPGGLSSYQKRDLGYQISDVVASAGSGAGAGTIALQQGPQILQSLAATEGGLGAGLKQLGVSALALVTPMTVALAAVTALGGGFLYAGISAGKEQEALEKSTRGIGAATGATAGHLDALAKANAEAGKVGTGTAREIAAGYASTGLIALPVFDKLIQSTQRYAQLTGQDTASATQELARAFGDLSTGAEAIAAKIGGLDDKTKQLIATQIEQGDRSGAQATAADYLKRTVDANTVATSGWAAAWDKATVAADGYWQAAKKIAGIKLGIVPEGAQEAVDRLNKEVDNINARRNAFGQEPLGLGDSVLANRDAARLILDTQTREANARAAEERADQASRIAGTIARASDPNAARLSELITQRSQLADALADPMARAGLKDFQQTETAYLGVVRAIETLTDANGKLVSSEEMTRRGNQLQLDAVNAKTDAEKALVAQRQKAFDLIGKAIPGSDASSQIDFAGRLSLASASSKGGGSDSDSRDEFDRAVRSTEDRIRRQEEEAQTFGMSAQAVARYRAETELLTAAKRADRDVTPELTSQMQALATRAGETASRMDDLRERMQFDDAIRGAGRSGFSGLLSDLRQGAGFIDAMTTAFGRFSDRMLNLASDRIFDTLFGRQGTSGGLLGGSGFGEMLSGLFHHEGGMVGRDGVPRLMPASAWNGAPRYHSGLRPDEVPAVLQKGEWVLSKDDVAAINQAGAGGGGGGSSSAQPLASPTVNVINNGPPVQAEARRNSDGSIDVILNQIEHRMASRLATGRGPLASMIPNARNLRG